MRAGGGKQKGASFERLVCKRLSLWITKGTRDDVFWRSAMSGGRATIGIASGLDRSTQSGDITAIHPAGIGFAQRFHVECKFYRDLNILSFVLGRRRGALYSFWNKLLAQPHLAFAPEKIPLLVAKQNGIPPLVITTDAGATCLKEEFGAAAQAAACIVFGTESNAYIYWMDEVFNERQRDRKRSSPNRPSK